MKVLIAEDNLDDIKLMMRAFRHPRGWEIKLVEDGEQALTALGVYAGHDSVWRPNLIILNLNMPKVCGHEVLRAIKQRPDLAPIPVVVWSVSCARSDIDLAYRLGAAAYFSKPADSQEFVVQAQAIREFFDRSQLYQP